MILTELWNKQKIKSNFMKTTYIRLTDNLKYSTVDIYIKETKLRIAEIAVTNSTNIDNKYKSDFLYSAKNAFVEGYYLIQRLDEISSAYHFRLV